MNNYNSQIGERGANILEDDYDELTEQEKKEFYTAIFKAKKKREEEARRLEEADREEHEKKKEEEKAAKRKKEDKNPEREEEEMEEEREERRRNKKEISDVTLTLKSIADNMNVTSVAMQENMKLIEIMEKRQEEYQNAQTKAINVLPVDSQKNDNLAYEMKAYHDQGFETKAAIYKASGMPVGEVDLSNSIFNNHYQNANNPVTVHNNTVETLKALKKYGNIDARTLNEAIYNTDNVAKCGNESIQRKSGIYNSLIAEQGGNAVSLGRSATNIIVEKFFPAASLLGAVSVFATTEKSTQAICFETIPSNSLVEETGNPGINSTSKISVTEIPVGTAITNSLEISSQMLLYSGGNALLQQALQYSVRGLGLNVAQSINFAIPGSGLGIQGMFTLPQYDVTDMYQGAYAKPTDQMKIIRSKSSSTITADNIIDLALTTLPWQLSGNRMYAEDNNTSYIGNQNTLAYVSKLKDSQGRYLLNMNSYLQFGNIRVQGESILKNPGMLNDMDILNSAPMVEINGKPWMVDATFADIGSGSMPVAYGQWRNAYALAMLAGVVVRPAVVNNPLTNMQNTTIQGFQTAMYVGGKPINTQLYCGLIVSA